MLAAMNPVGLEKNSGVKLLIDDKEVVLEKGVHFNVFKWIK